MQLEEVLEWQIPTSATDGSWHRRREHIRRRSKAVPGRARPCAAPSCRRSRSPRRWRRTRWKIERQRGRRLSRARSRTLRHRDRRSRSRSIDDVRCVVIGATPHGVPITIATVGDVRSARGLRSGPHRRTVGRGRDRRRAYAPMGENARTATEGVKSEARGDRVVVAEGTTIEPFYDRSALVNRAIRTVATNLLEGAALVIAVLFLLLGDLRAGAVVATTIPLSLLFAVMVMNAAAHLRKPHEPWRDRLRAHRRRRRHHRRERREQTLRSSRAARATARPEERLDTMSAATLEVRAASVFGEAIIAIVYLPVLALTGLEGNSSTPWRSRCSRARRARSCCRSR